MGTNGAQQHRARRYTALPLTGAAGRGREVCDRAAPSTAEAPSSRANRPLLRSLRSGAAASQLLPLSALGVLSPAGEAPYSPAPSSGRPQGGTGTGGPILTPASRAAQRSPRVRKLQPGWWRLFLPQAGQQTLCSRPSARLRRRSGARHAGRRVRTWAWGRPKKPSDLTQAAATF